MSNTGKPKKGGAPWQPPTEDEIRKRAYELYLERQQDPRGPLDDWLEAEAELFLRWKNNRNECS